VTVSASAALLEPLPLAGVTARNRLVFAPHCTNLAEGGLPGERLAAYFERRASGGVGVKRVVTKGRYLTAWLPRLSKGAYTVRWHAMSGDGHVVSGVFTFGVRARAPLATEAFGASGPTTSEHVVRWLYFLALALLVGGLGFRLLVLRRPLPARAEKRFYAVTGIGALMTLNVGIAAFILRAEDALQLPFGRLLYGDLSPIARSRFGTAFIVMTLGFALVTAFLFLAWLTDRAALLWPAFLLGLAFAAGRPPSGDRRLDSGSVPDGPESTSHPFRNAGGETTESSVALLGCK